MMIRLPAASFLPKPGALTDSLPPGAHAPSHGALLRPSSSRKPEPPKQVQPSPSTPASRASASATMSGGTAKRMTWCTTSALPGCTKVPVRYASFARCGSSRKHR